MKGSHRHPLLNPAAIPTSQTYDVCKSLLHSDVDTREIPVRIDACGRENLYRVSWSPHSQTLSLFLKATDPYAAYVMAYFTESPSGRGNNFPDRYIRHSNVELRIDPVSDSSPSELKQDATFFITY